MGIVEKVKIIDKMLSKYFVLFSILMFAFVFGWTYTGGKQSFRHYYKILASFLFLLIKGLLLVI